MIWPVKSIANPPLIISLALPHEVRAKKKPKGSFFRQSFGNHRPRAQDATAAEVTESRHADSCSFGRLAEGKKSRPPTGAATGAPRLETSSRRLAGRIVVGRGGGFRLRIIPRQPVRGPRLHLLGVVRQGQQIGEGIDPIEPAGVDQTHEHVADPGAIKRLVAEAVLAMHDRHFERLLAAVVVQRSAGLAEEQRQRLPVFEHIADGLPEAGVGFDVLAVEFFLHPRFELRHLRRTVGLMIREARGGIHFLRLGLGVEEVDLAQGVEHVPAFLGKARGHTHKLPPAMDEAVSENRGELLAGVAREGVAHLDRRRQVLVPLAQQRGQVFPGVPPARKKQRHHVPRHVGQETRGEGALALGVDRVGGVAARSAQFQDAHGGVVIVNQGGVGGQGDQRGENELDHLGQRRHQLPLGRLGQGHAQIPLEAGQPVVRHPGAVAQLGDRHTHARRVFFLTGLRRHRRGEHLATGVAAEPLHPVARGRNRGRALDAQDDRLGLLGPHGALGTERTAAARR